MTMQRTTWWNKVAQLVFSGAVCGALLFGGLGNNLVQGQDIIAPPAAPPATPAAAPAATPAAKKLTNDDLKTITENLGYEPEVDKIGDKINLLILKWKQGTFQFVVYLSISNSGENLIVQSPLKPLPADEMAYGKELAAVLAKSYTMSPSHFVVDDTRWLLMLRYVPNQDLTPAKIRTTIADFSDQVRNSESVWRCDRWEPKTITVAKPVAVVPELEGSWKITALSTNGTSATKESLESRKISVSISGDRLNFAENGTPTGNFNIRLGDSGSSLDLLHGADKVEKGLFAREGNKAKLVFGGIGNQRPADFTSKDGTTVIEMELVAK